MRTKTLFYLSNLNLSHVITHIHLKPTFKFALHDKDDIDKLHRTEDNPKQQLGSGHAADPITNIDIGLRPGFCENEWVENLVLWVKLCECWELLASCT